MSVESMVFFYGAVCAAMILFNCACVFVFRRRAKNTLKKGSRLIELIKKQMDELANGSKLSDKSMTRLEKKLQRVSGLMSFDYAIERLQSGDSARMEQYLAVIHPIFVHLAQFYLGKETAQGVYLLHLINKHSICTKAPFDPLCDIMLSYINKNGIYCKSKALEVLCSAGGVDKLVDAVTVLDRQQEYFPSKLMGALLLRFEGDCKTLIDALLNRFNGFSTELRVAVVGFAAKRSGDYCELFYNMLLNETDNELRYALMRYFGSHSYEPSRDYFYDLLDSRDTARWVDCSIAARALAIYPEKKTVAVLKQALTSGNWYVRFNAAESLERLGITYNELADILCGRDRFAREMITYRTEQNNLLKEGEQQP